MAEVYVALGDKVQAEAVLRGAARMSKLAEELQSKETQTAKKPALPAKLIITVSQKALQQAVSPVVQVIPADWGKGLEKLFESGEWKGPALAIGGVWLVLKLTELRRLRRLTRAMMAGR